MTVNTAQPILDLVQKWHSQGHKMAVATVTRTWGSAPRPVGSQLLIRDDGHFEGSVSGGCVEGAVLAQASEIISSEGNKIMEFGVTDEQAWEVGLACGGKISVFLVFMDRKKIDDFSDILKSISAGIPKVYATSLENGSSSLVNPEGNDDLAAMVRATIKTNKSQQVTVGNDEVLLQLFSPPLRMLIIGAVHIAQELAPIAKGAGFDVIVIDPRGVFTGDQRFSGIAVTNDWPDEALAKNPPDARTAVITLTHDPKLDDAALKLALRSPAFYIGSLGSKKTHAARLARLHEAGFSQAETDKIHGPVGLNIGAKSAAEIAISIIAQIIGTLRLEQT
jgi:xanthine dehydrogenase accessory factor